MGYCSSESGSLKVVNEEKFGMVTTLTGTVRVVSLHHLTTPMRPCVNDSSQKPPVRCHLVHSGNNERIGVYQVRVCSVNCLFD